MSRIGRQPIPVPQGVTVTIDKINNVSVKGPKGELSRQLSPDMIIKQVDSIVTVERPTNQYRHRQIHGLTRTLIDNMVKGVNDGYSKQLEIVGVGYRAVIENEELVLSVGLSYPARVKPRPGITFEAGTDQQSRALYVKISGINKETVGQQTADIQRLRPPDPYKGKGIRIFGQKIKLKPGKRGTAGGKK
jgi:large subunit ribosomal protein L6